MAKAGDIKVFRGWTAADLRREMAKVEAKERRANKVVDLLDAEIRRLEQAAKGEESGA